MILPPEGIGWFSQPKMTTFNPNGVSVTIAQNSPNRVALIFACPAGLVFMSINSPATSQTGLVMVQSMTPIVLTWGDTGSLVSQQWYGFGGVGTNLITVTEVFYRPLASSVDDRLDALRLPADDRLSQDDWRKIIIDMARKKGPQ